MKEIKLDINGKEYTVEINNFGAYEADVKVNGRSYKVGLKDLGNEQVFAGMTRPSVAPSPAPKSPGTSNVGPTIPSGGTGTINAPLPGLVLKIHVKVGDKVSKDQNLITMEAMKMENEVRSHFDGVIKEIHVKEDDSVNEGDLLITLG